MERKKLAVTVNKNLFVLITSLLFVIMVNSCSFSSARSESQQGAQSIVHTTIAVVNADMGVEIDGERQNYSGAIIEALDTEFTLVSPAMADSG